MTSEGFSASRPTMDGVAGGEQPDLRDHEMLGLTTEQNTANLVPAVQFGVRRYLAIDSHRAQAQNWGNGLAKILAERGVTHERRSLPSGADSSVSGVESALLEAVSGRGPLCWVLGGGLKTQQIAVWRVFEQRVQSGVADVALYSNAARRSTVVVSI